MQTLCFFSSLVGSHNVSGSATPPTRISLSLRPFRDRTMISAREDQKMAVAN
jgi:hypothetical protein